MADQILDALTALQRQMDEMPAKRAALIAEARAAGHSWPTIGRALGMSHAAAIKAATSSSGRSRNYDR